jgi:hypothetical protein
MVPAKLQRHKKHVDYKDKPIACSERKCAEPKHSGTNVTSVIKGENGNMHEASYTVNYQVKPIRLLIIPSHLA